MTGRLVLGRLAQAAFVLWAAFTASFVLLQLMPGDAVLIRFVGGDMGLSPEAVANIRAFYGADDPVWTQYLRTLVGFLGGDFGFSIASGASVAGEIAANLPATLWLSGLAFVAAIALALAVTLLATLPPFRLLRETFAALPGLLVSIPVFWLGIVLVQIVSFRLGLVSVIAPGPWERLILPVAAIAVPISAPIAQILLRNLDALSTQGFVTVARAKGATRGQVLLRHTLRNALLPVLTIAGLLFGELLAGAVVTETVFGLNGIGRLAERSVRNQDAAVLQAIVVVAAFGFVAVNLLVDLLYPLVDPRLCRTAEVTA
ncbi:ABC transporter permease [Aureimonas jatrophae]|uniref:Peptide/nickel transport system permease protein n=1 Tax=Aureimonas jatrophae TaxID=1166073 RepID=A0A1H0ML25_9HYPH|nr:ABC transporter permease [Aureimonas jatrophae]SDO81071.1 peptide/nickel transport system permease protein [Aureimonas jatrophae]